MFTIKYEIEARSFEMSFSMKEQANQFFLVLRNSGIEKIWVKSPSTQPETQPEEEEHMTVKVMFVPGGKRYTYLCKEKVSAKQVVVPTDDGPQVVQVFSCDWKTRAELEKDLPFSEYRYIIGEVIPA